ncbi:MAG: hypothetical protein A4E34_00663 [Methanoregula sp. PtaU1.Bin006]|jgi:hypothetical protein|nr:MAG: hypothetical protein A4E34_00663 [Methanoregula sp. PtaU1.Bin006]
MHQGLGLTASMVRYLRTLKRRSTGPLGHRSEIWILLAFGKNEQEKKLFLAIFVAMAVLAFTRVVDPGPFRKGWGKLLV